MNIRSTATVRFFDILLSPAWQRGYDARMYGVVEKNSEHLPEDQILYDAGVRAAECDDQTDRIEDNLSHHDDLSPETIIDWPPNGER